MDKRSISIKLKPGCLGGGLANPLKKLVHSGMQFGKLHPAVVQPFSLWMEGLGR
jgi:hypothetical protein